MNLAVVTGASGLLGRRLLARLPRARVLSHGRRSFPDVEQVSPWDASSELPPTGTLDGADVVFQLAGEPIAGRWTRAKKQAIKESRVLGTRNLVRGLAAARVRPRLLICASAVGYYGDRGAEALSEDAAAGNGFLAEVCREWELEASRATALGVRVVSLRFGTVLAPDGGALAPLRASFRWGLGAELGSGDQWMSWIHIDDAVELLLFCAANEALRGAVNAVSPNPCTQREFSAQLAQALGRSAWLRVPSVALRAGLGEMSELVLFSQRVLPTKALASGFRFRFPELDSALMDCAGRTGAA